MPKPFSNKCLLCSQLSTAQAKIVHGSDGDNCWDAKYCHNRRSFYRRRASQTNDAEIDTMTVEPPANYFAVLYLYKAPGDKPLHALGAELWYGQKAICRLEPIHCFGLTAGKIKAYTEQVLKAFSQKYNCTLAQYKEMFEVNPSKCPIPECPLRSDV